LLVRKASGEGFVNYFAAPETKGCVVNIALLAQRIETPGQTSHESLVGKVSRLVERLSLTNRVPAYRTNLNDLTVASRALEAAKTVDQLVSHLQGRIAELEKLAETDELTGLLNRRGFNSQLQRALSNACRYDEQGVLIYIDLDGFKPINDTYGHAAGDEVLCQVANQLHETIRDTDYVARLGGDEFAVLLTRTTWENGLSRAELIEKQLNSTIVNWQGRMIAVAASFGLQIYGAKDEGLDLLGKADEAMYKTKRLRSDLGGNTSNGRRATL
jgi:diguanylate cyclase (GGDEF)-like protein